MFGHRPEGGLFDDRSDAGRQLAAKLMPLDESDPVVVALPRGGLPVGREIANALGAPLEIFAVRKLGAPFNPEYGIGAVAEDGSRLVDSEALHMLGLDQADLDTITARETAELERQVTEFRGNRPPMPLKDRNVIVVDDGVATGVTDTVALRAIRRQNPARLILAVPVCPPGAAAALETEADTVVALPTPPHYHAIGQSYRDFSQVSDEEVVSILEEANPTE